MFDESREGLLKMIDRLGLFNTVAYPTFFFLFLVPIYLVIKAIQNNVHTNVWLSRNLTKILIS